MANKPRFFKPSSKTAQRQLPARPVEADILNFSHDLRGVARVGGKPVFIDNALPGERVRFRYSERRARFDEGQLLEVLETVDSRVEPRCPHIASCGGCSLQHLQAAAQIAEKERILLDQLTRIGEVAVPEVLPPLTGESFGYRRKARIGIRFQRRKKGSGRDATQLGLTFGFRAKRSNELVDIRECHVLHPAVAEQIPALRQLVVDSEGRDSFTHLEVAVGEDAAALVLRHTRPLSAADEQRWRQFAIDTGIHLYLQPGDAASAHRLWPESGEERLRYRLPEFGLELHFHPLDFVQVNLEVNRQMVERAVALLDPQADERVLDLFCGLGNFTLPLARRAGRVVGVEGEGALIARAEENAAANGIGNVQFVTADLTAELRQHRWAAEGFDKVLLDPPRAGAVEVLAQLARLQPRRIVYVSCNPSTLARDAGALAGLGYRLQKAGVMDMFPHTAHVESIAVFEPVQ
ncbi:23S rRNA (uracil(1939)-C(5))-methyltransferase RlmD [Microbulbifer guangxiensis]|uniref:23S rRNA (uracil(1939)-C(5))-methyltransferase RlmD n=1 Tax=Microbulbifer guangxiensis TaxID=2904249 RepID=UPI001F011D61|nr:23S rRNA (uracil(1939)-C(5))-methyltransferase RlmD [Microbulbifer guangxiensis]